MIWATQEVSGSEEEVSLMFVDPSHSGMTQISGRVRVGGPASCAGPSAMARSGFLRTLAGSFPAARELRGWFGKPANHLAVIDNSSPTSGASAMHEAMRIDEDHNVVTWRDCGVCQSADGGAVHQLGRRSRDTVCSPGRRKDNLRPAARCRQHNGYTVRADPQLLWLGSGSGAGTAVHWWCSRWPSPSLAGIATVR